ncbi:hypothetical protein EMIT0P253_140076 [Pseudomonas sp. IT-P253]
MSVINLLWFVFVLNVYRVKLGGVQVMKA